MIPLVLFDFDGVIVDSLEYFLDAFLDSCAEQGVHEIRTREDFLALFDTNFYAGMARRGLLGARRDAVFHGMAERLKAGAGQYDFFPGMPETLRALAGFTRLYVITSNDSAVVRDWLHARGLPVAREVLGSDVDPSKVRKIRALAARHRGAPLYYVGDTAGDMHEAREAGAIAVAAAWGWHGRDRLHAAQPDLLADSPADLLAHFQRTFPA